MSLWLMVGVLIGLGVITLLYRKDIFRKKEKIEPIPHTPYNKLERVSSPHFVRASELPFDKNKYYHYALEIRMRKKIDDLKDQLIRNEKEDGFQLDAKDEVRYEAMIEILEAMLE